MFSLCVVTDLQYIIPWSFKKVKMDFKNKKIFSKIFAKGIDK